MSKAALVKRIFIFTFGLLAFGLLVMVLGHDPYAIHLPHILQAPAGGYWLGTDELGRDVLARLAQGVRLSVFVGVSVFLLAGSIGTLIGVISGWFGGWVDALLMRVTDVFLSFPGILIAIAFAALAGPGVENVILALGLMGWVTFARLARVQTMAVKEQDYVRSAQISNVKLLRIIALYILPNIAAPLIVEGVFTMAGAMLAEAGLSFLGIGVQPPVASLGSMLREGARYMLVAPHLVFFPGLALMLLVIGLNIIGDSLRDYLDKREEGPR